MCRRVYATWVYLLIFGQRMDFLNKMLPKYVKIWFDDTKEPVNKVKAVKSPNSKEHILAYNAHSFNYNK